ncbi:MAG: hypothetical protein AAF098_12570, partial [Pseudomonadota bacterium]
MLLPGRQGFASIFYERHRPEQTLLYQLVEAHYPVVVERMAQHSLEFHRQLKTQHPRQTYWRIKGPVPAREEVS